MANSADRRPWLIISRREAKALLRAVEHLQAQRDPDLERAVIELHAQLHWIETGHGRPSDKESAVAREWGFSA